MASFEVIQTTLTERGTKRRTQNNTTTTTSANNKNMTTVKSAHSENNNTNIFNYIQNIINFIDFNIYINQTTKLI